MKRLQQILALLQEMGFISKKNESNLSLITGSKTALMACLVMFVVGCSGVPKNSAVSNFDLNPWHEI